MDDKKALQTALKYLDGRLMPGEENWRAVANNLMQSIDFSGLNGEKEREILVEFPLPTRELAQKLLESCKYLPDDAAPDSPVYQAKDMGVFFQGKKPHGYNFTLEYGNTTLHVKGVPVSGKTAVAEQFWERFDAISEKTDQQVPLAYMAPIIINGRTFLNTGNHDMLQNFAGLVKTADMIDAAENDLKLKGDPNAHFHQDVLLADTGLKVLPDNQVGIGPDFFKMNSRHRAGEVVAALKVQYEEQQKGHVNTAKGSFTQRVQAERALKPAAQGLSHSR